MSKVMKVIIVGRHTPDLGSEAAKYEVVANEAVTFSNDREEAIKALAALGLKALELGATGVLMQNTPGIVTAALLRMQADAGGQLPFQFGVIISVPGERLAGVVTEHKFQADPDAVYGPQVAEASATVAAQAVAAANGRAKTEIVQDGGNSVLKVTVDPVTPFVFSQVEWF